MCSAEAALLCINHGIDDPSMILENSDINLRIHLVSATKLIIATHEDLSTTLSQLYPLQYVPTINMIIFDSSLSLFVLLLLVLGPQRCILFPRPRIALHPTPRNKYSPLGCAKLSFIILMVRSILSSTQNKEIRKQLAPTICRCLHMQTIATHKVLPIETVV